MTWTRLHRRSDVLRAVVETLDADRVGTLPWDLPGVAENFTDESDLVGALLLRWHARLGANLDRELAREPLDLPGAVVAAWARTAEEHPGIRRAADEALVDPLTAALEQTVLRARDRERARLAAAAGLAPESHPRAAALGEDLEARARDLVALPLAPTPAHATRSTSALPTFRDVPSHPTTRPGSSTSSIPSSPTAQEAPVLRKKTTTKGRTSPSTPAPVAPTGADAPHEETVESFVRRLKAALAAA
ncbi:MAG: hypothetical protein JWR20_2632 [Marmoricola sp.]|nr:hypothetical protein [Marmoricola sp.]